MINSVPLILSISVINFAFGYLFISILYQSSSYILWSPGTSTKQTGVLIHNIYIRVVTESCTALTICRQEPSKWAIMKQLNNTVGKKSVNVREKQLSTSLHRDKLFRSVTLPRGAAKLGLNGEGTKEVKGAGRGLSHYSLSLVLCMWRGGCWGVSEGGGGVINAAPSTCLYHPEQVVSAVYDALRRLQSNAQWQATGMRGRWQGLIKVCKRTTPFLSPAGRQRITEKALVTRPCFLCFALSP